MGACLREVEILAFLKVKREEARQSGLATHRARFAELASWFYRRSAIGGVDHVCLVFRGGGISLREAVEERSPLLGAFAVAAAAPAEGEGEGEGRDVKRPLRWTPGEVVAVAGGLLEVGGWVGGKVGRWFNLLFYTDPVPVL